MTRFWFSPNAQSDILPLFDRPQAWAYSRSLLSGFQFYTGGILSDIRYIPNIHESLEAADAYATLKRWKIPIALEAGVVKEWSPNARQALKGTKEAIARIHGSKGKVTFITMDEPAHAGKKLGQTPEETADATAWYVKELRGTPYHLDIRLIEPYPALKMSEILRFVELIQARGGGPAGLTLDIDRFGLSDQGIKEPQFRRDLHLAQRRCHEWEIPLSIIFFGQRAKDEREYAHSVIQWAERVKPILKPDVAVIQSWEQRYVNGSYVGPKTLPYNLPEVDPISHCGLINRVHEILL